MHRRWLYLAIAVTAAAALVPFAIEYRQESRTPDRAAMLRQVVSRLTDDEIRSRRADADRKYRQLLASAREDADTFLAQRLADMAKCDSDAAFKARNADRCVLPVGWQSMHEPPPGSSSVDEIFERDLLGMCAFASTIRDAKKWKCLPE